MRAVIVAELLPGGQAGGIEQAIIGLAHGLSHLDDEEEDDYIFTVRPSSRDWLRPYMGPRGRIVARTDYARRGMHAARRSVGALGMRVGATLGIGSKQPRFALARSTGFYEALAPDVIHFPYQYMTLTALPSIFGPYDLQHRHHPEFFSPEEIRRREFYYPAWCRHATVVETASAWAALDFISQYSLDPAKLHVIRRGAPASLYASDATGPSDARTALNVPDEFCLYPAQTWPHKNHLRLLEAVARVRDDHAQRIQVVCTGAKNAHWPEIAAQLSRLDLEKMVHFVGFVSPAHLRSLYQRAQFMIFPSLFEGAGLPILEAFAMGTPLACADVTSLPEYAGDAALLFDPYSVDAIAAALRRMHGDADLRARLRAQGLERVKQFSWEKTARHFRALYRLVGGADVSEEDRALLATGVVTNHGHQDAGAGEGAEC